ncbi:MAG: hypothetical protein FWE38_00445 [Firmicutes bacterium]|nr:hypothetical protein [Bacillota bacterium]
MLHIKEVRASRAMLANVWPEEKRNQAIDESFAPTGQTRIGARVTRKNPPSKKRKKEKPPPGLRLRAKRSACGLGPNFPLIRALCAHV